MYVLPSIWKVSGYISIELKLCSHQTRNNTCTETIPDYDRASVHT